MSNKFEQLLDYLVNEEMEKANELFHEIVVEKSREIYSDLISEEVKDEDEELDEVRDEDDDEEQDEGFMHDEEDESMYEIGGDASDDMISDVEDPIAMGDHDMDDMDDDDEEHATKSDIMDIKDDLAELKAEFEALLASEQDEEEHEAEIDDFDNDGDLDVEDEEDEEDEEEVDETFMREYREVVGKPYSGGKVAGTKEEATTNTHSPVSSAKGRPTSGADASNIAQPSKGEGQQVGLAGKTKGEFTKGVDTNVDGKQSGVKKLSKVSDGHGAEKKGHGETNVNDKPILKSMK